MNETINKFLLAGDKLMPEMHLRQPGFTYSACGPFTKNKERIKNLKKQVIQDIFIKTNFIKLVFKIIWLMEILKIYLEERLLIRCYMIKHLILLKIQSMLGFTSMAYTFFDKNTSGGVIKSEIMSNKELAKELHKLIIRKFEKQKVYSSFIGNIWGADLADMQLISKFNNLSKDSII